MPKLDYVEQFLERNWMWTCDKHFVEADIETITTNSWKITESGNEPVELKSFSETICNYQYFFQPLKGIVKQTTKTLLF